MSGRFGTKSALFLVVVVVVVAAAEAVASRIESSCRASCCSLLWL